MRVLVACEFSGIVRDAFRARGHDAWSCDLLETDTEDKRFHMIRDVRSVVYSGSVFEWDLMIAHPPCTYLTVSQAWTFARPDRFPKRDLKRRRAIAFCEGLWNAPIKKICIENPVGFLSTMSRLGKPSQIIQPWQFGHDASKRTCLWLKNLPLLKPTEIIEKARYANQTPSGQNKLPPSELRWKDRSVSYSGIAKAMAEQWG